jgi:hypothetical protein
MSRLVWWWYRLVWPIQVRSAGQRLPVAMVGEGVGTCCIILEASEKGVPVVESIDDINDTGGDLAGEVRKLGGKTMYDNHMEEGFQYGLA